MTCYLVDLSSWARAAFETVPPAYAPNGEPVAVTRIVVNKLVRLLRDDRPRHLAFCADTAGPVWQTELWPSYKKDRKDPGEEYRIQYERIIEILRLHRIPVYRARLFQADDCFAAALKRIRSTLVLVYVVLVTKDHDLWQLIEGSLVHAFGGPTKNDGGGVIDEDAVWKRYGVGPKLLGDLKALVGDKDEAPGVPLIGEKTAAKLLNRHGSLAAVLDAWAEEKGKLRERLRDGRALALLSRELVGLRADAPIDFDPVELRVGWSAADAAHLRLLAVDLGIGVMANVDALPKRTS